MAYSSEIAQLLSAQLSRFITLNRHQLFGQIANLDFWMNEVRHCLEVIDGYPRRFEQLKQAQTKHMAEHGTVGYSPLGRVPHTELGEARRTLCEATYRFLLRGFHERQLDESTLRQRCRDLGIGVEASDLRPRNNSTRGRGPS